MKTLSLRGRLLLATAALVALGLAAADVSTYALLRSSLVGRIDRQLDTSRQFAVRLFEGARGGFPGGDGGFPGPLGDRRDGAPQVTYVAVLDASGTVVASRTFGFGVVRAPALPPALPGSGAQPAAPPRHFSAGAAGASARYRVLAAPLANPSGTLVVAVPLDDVTATLRRLLLVESGVTIAVVAAAVALAMWLVRVGLKPLSDMETTAAAIAAGSLSRRVEPAEPGTEVGRLGLALNEMLERIEAAFAAREASEARLRRFVGDASHELRTPLTSIRGYAELFRRGAATKPDDLEKSMLRIEEEGARMGKLVDELLLLARLDQRRPLEREQVDLVKIARDVIADANAVDPGRAVGFDGPEGLRITGDDARLHQLAANLVGNALAHTPPEAAIHVRVSREDDLAILEVADEGPGLSEEDAARVFDRFFRVDASRSRHNGGVGLGLSIVAAIAEAHGGTATVDAAPGAGARFVVRLPTG